ncbi:Reverse transcriptase zinc-binding domain [Macleaya cordata]|uniref:Reverse transcriptase zinc-binding domain n=1 Tax=Macleaya cordata TaxID=56857 RepID=A0A200PMT1_MACCD|nr:Reverse transcriptase zinc-binding domain [Macleaya cordata]
MVTLVGGTLLTVFKLLRTYIRLQYTQGSISEFITESEFGHDWSLNLRRDPRTSKLPQLLSLLQSIGATPPNLDAAEDTICWSLSKDEHFTVKTTYDHLLGNEENVENFPTRLIWNHRIPPKIFFFTWTAYLNKILVLDNLQKRGHQLANACYFCLRNEECANHLLLHCPYTREIWAGILPQFGWCWPFARTFALFLQGWNCKGLTTQGKRIWYFIPAAIAWGV